MTTTRNHDDKKGLSLQAAAFRSRSHNDKLATLPHRQAAPSAERTANDLPMPMDKSNSFLIKNLLSSGDLLSDSADQLQQQAMMMMQMKLAFEWLSQLQQPEAQQFHRPLFDSPSSGDLLPPHSAAAAAAPTLLPPTAAAAAAAVTSDSRPASANSADKAQHHWDLKADGEPTAFRPIAKADCPRTFCVNKRNKKLVLHRIIGLMVPQFRPSLTSNDDCSLPCSAHSSLPSHFAQDRVKLELPTSLPIGKFPVSPFATNADNLQRFCAINNHHFQSDAMSMKSIEQNRKDDKGEKRRKRTTFTQEQLNSLEHEFQSKKYLTLEERAAIADTLGLSQVQIKIWWQNRRASYKRSKICLVTSSPGDATSSTSEKLAAVTSADSRPKIVVPIPVHVSRRMTVQHGKNSSSIARGLPTATPHGFAFGMF